MPDSTTILWTAWLTLIAAVGAAVGWLGARGRWIYLSGAADLSRQGHGADIYNGAD